MESNRDQQILQLRGLVHMIAGNMAMRHRSEFDDMVSDGWEGAIDAVDRYDPDNEAGASLATFAKYRIRGAIMDGLRHRDYLRISHRRAIVAGTRQAERPPVSLDELLSKENEDGDYRATQVVDLVAGRAIDDMLARISVGALLLILPERQAFAIKRRYWDDYTILRIAAELGVSGQRISQLISAGEKTLRESLVTTR